MVLSLFCNAGWEPFFSHLPYVLEVQNERRSRAEQVLLSDAGGLASTKNPLHGPFLGHWLRLFIHN